MSFRIPNVSGQYDFPDQHIITYGLSESTVIEGVTATCYRISGTGQNRYLLMQINDDFEFDLEPMQTLLPMDSVTITKNWDVSVNPFGELAFPTYENAENDFSYAFLHSRKETFYPSIVEIRNFSIPSKAAGQIATLDLVIEPVSSAMVSTYTGLYTTPTDHFDYSFIGNTKRIFFVQQGEFTLLYKMRTKCACKDLDGRFTIKYNTLETMGLPTMNLYGNLQTVESVYPCTRTFKFGS